MGLAAKGGKEMGRFLVAAMGLSFYWPLLRRRGLSYILFGHNATAIQANSWYAAFLCLVMVVVGLGTIPRVRRMLQAKAVTVVDGKGPRARRVVGALLAMPLAVGLFKALELLVLPSEVSSWLFAFASLVAFAVTFVELTLIFAIWVVSLDAKSAELAVFGTVAASFLVSLITPGMGLATTVLFCCSPLLSTVCGLLGVMRNKTAITIVESTNGKLEQALSPLQLRFIILAAIFLILGGVIRGVTGNPLGEELSAPPVGLDLASVVLALLAFVGCFAWRETRRWSIMLWFIPIMLLFCGLLVIAVLGDQGRALGYQVCLIGRTYLSVFLWLSLTTIVRAGAIRVYRAFALVFVPIDTLSGLLGYIMPSVLSELIDFSYAGMIGTFAAVVLLLLIVTVLMAVAPTLEAGTGAEPEQANYERGLAEQEPAGTNDGVNQVIIRLTEQYGLTERETQVAALLAAGNTQRKIADTMHISIGTAQTHIKQVYRKLGIHSKQELIDLAHRE